jgi:hypothetical protein
VADVDYYKVTVPSGSDGTLTASVDARGLSLLTPQLSVYDASGNLVATASAGTAYGSVATVKLTGLSAGQTYYLAADCATTDVFGMGAYRLAVQFGGLTPPPPPPITADRFEPNDTVTTATGLGTLTSTSQTGLTLHTSADVDYYKFTAGSKGTFTVTITPSQGSGTLNLALLNSKQTVLARGQSQTGGVTLSASLAGGQSYYVEVWSSSGGLFGYGLSIAKSAGGGGKRLPGAPLLLPSADGLDPSSPQPQGARQTNGSAPAEELAVTAGPLGGQVAEPACPQQTPSGHPGGGPLTPPADERDGASAPLQEAPPSGRPARPTAPGSPHGLATLADPLALLNAADVWEVLAGLKGSGVPGDAWHSPWSSRPIRQGAV